MGLLGARSPPCPAAELREQAEELRPEEELEEGRNKREEEDSALKIAFH